MTDIPAEAQELIAKFEKEEVARRSSRPQKLKENTEALESRKVQDILDAATNLGYKIREGHGSHKVIVKPDGTCMPIPVHGTGAELGKGLAHKIYKFIRPA